jgi:hypothetical protein
MMGIMVPETCWASNKICNKNSSVASSWHFISTYNRYWFTSVPELQYSSQFFAAIAPFSHASSNPLVTEEQTAAAADIPAK